MRTKNTRFNIGHENVNKYGYQGDIHMQTADAIKDTFLVTNNITKTVDKDRDSYIMGLKMTQYSLKVGLKKSGDSGEEAVVKELTQLYDMENFFPMNPKELSRKEGVKSASSLMFLKLKHDRKLKGRAYDNTSEKHRDIDKEDATSPTATTGSVLIAEAIDAYERINVAIFDISCAYMHTDTDEDIIMVLEGVFDEFMVTV